MFKKLFIILMGIYLVICSGSIFIYPLYLEAMSKQFGFSLQEVNLFGSFITIGFWISFPVGAIFDKCGPKVSLLIGLVMISGPYIALHFLFNVVEKINISIFLFIGLLMGQGGAILYTTGVTTNLKNFKFKESGTIVGLLVASEALSPSLFTTYREKLSYINIENFFIIVAVFVGIIVTICTIVFAIIRNPYSEDEELKEYEKHKEKFIIRFLLVINFISLVIYLIGIIVNNEEKSDKFPNYIIYPCIQILNFSVIGLEALGVFDKILYEDFIESHERGKKERLTSGIGGVEGTEGRERTSNSNAISGKDLRDSKNNENMNDITTEMQEVNSSIRLDSKDEKIDTGYEEAVDDSGEVVKEKKKEFTSPIKEKEKKDKNNKGNINIINEPDNADGEVDRVEVDINFHSNLSSKEEANENEENKNEPILEPNQGDISTHRNIQENEHDKKSNLSQEKLVEVTKLDKAEEERIIGIACTDYPENQLLKFSDAFKDLRLYILLVILIFGIGTTISNLNNIEFIIKSLTIDYSHSEIFEYVILYFAFNSFVRIIGGFLLDKLIETNRQHYFLVFATFLGLVSQLIGISMNKKALVITLSLAGASHGCLMTYTPLFVKTQFGTDHYGKLIGVLTTGNALGVFIVSDFIFISYYQGNYDEKLGRCVGTRCFYPSFIITSVFMLLNLGLSIMFLRMKKKELELKKSDETTVNNNI